MYIKKKGPLDRLFGLHPIEKRFPVMFQDSWLPSFSKTLLYGLDFDFMMLEVLVIALMDKANNGVNNIKSGLALGVLIAYVVEYSLIWLREYKGRRNIAQHTLSDEKFLI
jgi:hypothetical protein